MWAVALARRQLMVLPARATHTRKKRTSDEEDRKHGRLRMGDGGGFARVITLQLSDRTPSKQQPPSIKVL